MLLCFECCCVSNKGVGKLPVVVGEAPVLDGKPGAVVEAAQAQGALCLCPLWVSVVHRNGFGGAVAGALSATYASVGKVEGRCGAAVLIQQPVQAVHKGGEGSPYEVAALSPGNHGRNALHVGDGLLGDAQAARGVRKVEDGRPHIHHAHAEGGIEGYALLAEKGAHLAVGVAAKHAEGGGGKGVLSGITADIERADEVSHQGGESPEMDGEDPSQHLVFFQADDGCALVHERRHVKKSFARGLRDEGGQVLAVARAAEMENHRLFLFGAEGHEVHLFLGFFL